MLGETVRVLQSNAWSKVTELDLVIEGDDSHHLTDGMIRRLAEACRKLFCEAEGQSTIEMQFDGIAFSRSGHAVSCGRRRYRIEVSVDYSSTNTLPFRLVGHYLNGKRPRHTPHVAEHIFSVFFTAVHCQGGTMPSNQCATPPWIVHSQPMFVPFQPESGMEGHFISHEAVEEGLVIVAPARADDQEKNDH